MPKAIKYFLIGMSKTLDIGNTTRIYEKKQKSNIRNSWKNVGSSIEKNLLMEKEIGQSRKTRAF